MVFEKVKEFLAQQLGVDPKSLTLETNIVEDLGADSLDVVEMLMTVETEYDIEIPDDEIEKFKTIGDVVDFIQNNMA